MPEEYSKDDFVTVFSSRHYQAEVEAEAIHGLLESAGLESLIVRENVQELPTGSVAVRVLASDLEDAQQLIKEAQQKGDLPGGEKTEPESSGR